MDELRHIMSEERVGREYLIGNYTTVQKELGFAHIFRVNLIYKESEDFDEQEVINILCFVSSACTGWFCSTLLPASPLVHYAVYLPSPFSA